MADKIKAYGLEWCAQIGVVESVSLTLDPTQGCGSFTMLTDDTIDISAGSVANQPYDLIVTGGATKTITWGSSILAPNSTFAVASSKIYIFQFRYISGKWCLPVEPSGV